MKQVNLIEARQITKIFPMGDVPVRALNNVDLDISRGEFTGIVGPSGSGKTTLLNIMGALDVPTSGSMLVLGHKIETLTHKAASKLRNEHLGFIFQSFNLLPVYSVYENVEFPLLLKKIPADERKKMVLQSLEWMHLTDKIKAKPSQLSGGQSQRVAIARAMVKNPELVLADEPTANLDAENSHHILRLMKKLNEELNTTFLFSTHDEKVVQYLSRIITLKDGRIFSDEEKEPQLTAQPETIQE